MHDIFSKHIVSKETQLNVTINDVSRSRTLYTSVVTILQLIIMLVIDAIELLPYASRAILCQPVSCSIISHNGPISRRRMSHRPTNASDE